MTQQLPLWLENVLRLERAVGGPVEAVVDPRIAAAGSVRALARRTPIEAVESEVSVSPRIDEILEGALNAYEDVIRRSCELQRACAHTLPFEPARSILDTTADLTRDIAAMQLSAVRWLLDA